MQRLISIEQVTDIFHSDVHTAQPNGEWKPSLQVKRYISKLGNEYRLDKDDVVEVDIDKIKNGYDVSGVT